MSRIEIGATLKNGVDLKKFAPRNDINGQTFLRIVNDICRSPITPRLQSHPHGRERPRHSRECADQKRGDDRCPEAENGHGRGD